MARPSKFSTDEILDVACGLLLDDGPAALTVSAVARNLGAPSGSIYHRFNSRDLLIAMMWLRAVEHFHQHIEPIFDTTETYSDVVRISCGVVTWAREFPLHAQVLLLHSASALLHDGWPDEVIERNQAQLQRLQVMQNKLCKRVGAKTAAQKRRLGFAIMDIPYAAVRLPLSRGEAPSKDSEQLVADAVTGVLAALTKENT